MRQNRPFQTRAILFADFLSTRLPSYAGRRLAAGRVQSARKSRALPFHPKEASPCPAHRIKSRFSVKSRNPNPSPTGKIKFGFLSLGRSGETRTRGLLLPKQARYQLRNTPAAEYSIPRLGRFVNRELPPGRRRGRPYPNSVSRVDSTPSSSLEGQTARAACFTSAGAFAMA